MNKDTICKWCGGGDLIIAPAYPVKHRAVRCGNCQRKQAGAGCDCYDPTYCDCGGDKGPLPDTPSANKVKTTIVPSGTGFECSPPCGWCGTNKCKSYKEWFHRRGD